MKKYMVFLITLAVLVSAGIFAVSAETQTQSDAVWCDRCNKYVPASEWVEWTAAGGDVTQEGHYYLADNFTSQETTVNIPALKFDCLDLRGNTWITDGISTLSVYGDLSIMDSVGGGKILTTGENEKIGGFAYVGIGGALNLYNVAVQYVPRSGISLVHGGLLYIDNGSVNMDGATVSGGVVTATGTSNGTGGNVHMTGGRLSLTGGAIVNGMAFSNGGTKNVRGGNVYATDGAEIVISGGSVTGGYSDEDGGNFYLVNAKLTLADQGEISKGHAVRHGGNMQLADATTVVKLTGGAVTGGVAGGKLASTLTSQGVGGGGNIYGYKGTLDISDCTIDGNMRLDKTMSAVTLSGVVKIGLGTSAGMMLGSGCIVNAEGLAAGSEIFVRASGNKAFTAAIPADKLETVFSYFKGAVRTELSMDTTNNTINAKQGTTGYCPHCYDPANPQTVTWTAGIGNGSSATKVHYYLSGSNTGTSQVNYYNTAVLDLNGYTLQRDGNRCVLLTAGMQFTLMDSCGGGRMMGTGTGEANDDSGVLQYAAKNAEFILMSGNMIMDPGTGTSMVLYGGIVNASSTGTKFTMRGGVIKGGSLAAEGATGGGNIRMGSTSGKLTISAGIVKDGNAGAFPGGNIHSIAPVEISGGVILNGNASAGGNIYCYYEYKKDNETVKLGDVDITGGIIWGGTSSGNGGNINTVALDISGGTIAKGTSSTGSGGNIRLGDGSSSISGNATILSGDAAKNGGSIYCVQNMTLDIQGGLIAGGNANYGGILRQNGSDCTLNLTGGTVAMGTATDGGNFYINNGTLRMTGGAVVAGTASSGGNIYLNQNVYGRFLDDNNEETPLPVVSHGTATNGKGGNIAFMAKGNSDVLKYDLQLGDCEIYGGSATTGNNIYINNLALFEVLPEFARQTSVYFHNDLIKEDLYLDNTHAFCNGAYGGTLLLENKSNLPKIVTTLTDRTLVIGQAALIMKDGSALWYGSNAEAIAAYNQQVAYIQVGAGEIALTEGTFVVDLVGQNVTLTGSNANVYCFDSANLAFKTYGAATINGPALMNTVVYTANGKTYVTIAETQENTYSFHHLVMDVGSVSFRPGSAGIYFGCNWECDSKLKEKMTCFGTAVSVQNMPGADFAADTDTLYTEHPAKDLETGNEYNSVLIDGIFRKSAANNDQRGVTPVYVTPYVTFTDAAGNSNSITCTEELSYSLYDVLQLVEKQTYYANKAVLENFLQTWHTAMADWKFERIGVKPQDDDTIRILMIGNSFCSYYTDELYGLLMETLPEGVTAVEVYNLYASGRTMTAHYNLWANQRPGDYALFRVDANGRFKLQPNNGYTLEDALAYANWDYISLQGKPSSGSYADEAGQPALDAMCEELSGLAAPLFERIHEMFPYTQLLWHRTWAQEVGRITDSGFEYTEAYNSRYDPGMQYVCDYMTEVFDQDKPYDLIQVNSGAAWKEARRLNDLLPEGEKLLPYGGLCAMLGRNTFGDKRDNSGDGQHDGDIGGGQLINAYMWYMTITGDADLTDNNYKPAYEMSDDLWNMLKQACMTTYETYYLQKN